MANSNFITSSLDTRMHHAADVRLSRKRLFNGIESQPAAWHAFRINQRETSKELKQDF